LVEDRKKTELLIPSKMDCRNATLKKEIRATDAKVVGMGNPA